MLAVWLSFHLAWHSSISAAPTPSTPLALAALIHRLQVYLAMWVLSLFLVLQLYYHPSSNHMLNRVDSHALQALIYNLNIYLLMLPDENQSKIVEPGWVWGNLLEIGLLALHGSVILHLLILLLLGFHEIAKTVVGRLLGRLAGGSRAAGVRSVLPRARLVCARGAAGRTAGAAEHQHGDTAQGATTGRREGQSKDARHAAQPPPPPPVTL